MTLRDVVARAVKGDPLGEQATRSCWNEEVAIEVCANSNSMHFIGIEGEMRDYSPCIDDILSDDWIYLGSAFNEDHQ